MTVTYRGTRVGNGLKTHAARDDDENARVRQLLGAIPRTLCGQITTATMMREQSATEIEPYITCRTCRSKLAKGETQ